MIALLRTLRPQQWVKNVFVGAPLVFAAESTQTSIGPLGPVRVALTLAAASGIMAMIGRPALPLQLQ